MHCAAYTYWNNCKPDFKFLRVCGSLNLRTWKGNKSHVTLGKPTDCLLMLGEGLNSTWSSWNPLAFSEQVERSLTVIKIRCFSSEMKLGDNYMYCLGFLRSLTSKLPWQKYISWTVFLNWCSFCGRNYLHSLKFCAGISKCLNIGARLQCLFSVKKHPMVPAYWINSHKHYIGWKKIGNHLGINYSKIDTHSTLFCNIIVEIDMPQSPQRQTSQRAN